jgi:hypothetical protein
MDILNAAHNGTTDPSRVTNNVFYVFQVIPFVSSIDIDLMLINLLINIQLKRPKLSETLITLSKYSGTRTRDLKVLFYFLLSSYHR